MGGRQAESRKNDLIYTSRLYATINHCRTNNDSKQSLIKTRFDGFKLKTILISLLS